MYPRASEASTGMILVISSRARALVQAFLMGAVNLLLVRGTQDDYGNYKHRAIRHAKVKAPTGILLDNCLL